VAAPSAQPWLTPDRDIAIIAAVGAVIAAIAALCGVCITRQEHRIRKIAKLPNMVLTIAPAASHDWHLAFLKVTNDDEARFTIIRVTRSRSVYLTRSVRSPTRPNGSYGGVTPSPDMRSHSLLAADSAWERSASHLQLAFFVRRSHSMFRMKSRMLAFRVVVEEKSPMRLRTRITINSNAID
jgi:hypothetical protein